MATVDRDVRRDRGGFSSAPIATFRATFGFPASPISRPVKTSQSLCATGAALGDRGWKAGGAIPAQLQRQAALDVNDAIVGQSWA